MNPLRRLSDQGQAVWLDFIRRKLLVDGGLARLIEADGLRGMTSNPSIFQQAIGGSDDYDEELQELLGRRPATTASELYEALAIEDIRRAADLLAPVYGDTGGDDGYVSLEVSPYLAHDTEATLVEARRLWQAVDRPNLMIKVPGTAAGVPAIEELTAEGINVNVTLLFSLSDYEAVAQAYVRGLERCTRPQQVASVASFFVSRVDSAIDRQLDGIAGAEALLGKAAIANAKVAYRRFQEIFGDSRFAALKARGARPQRVLWASTSTKNPAYRDVLYVEELIGRDTVNTLPPKTLEAFRDHGEVRSTLDQGVDEARGQLAALADHGVDLDAVTDQLQADGVAAFARSFDDLLAAVEGKRRAVLAQSVAALETTLGDSRWRVHRRLQSWQDERFSERLWRRDPTLFGSDWAPELVDRLGWLALPESMRPRLANFTAFADEIRGEGFERVLLLGMGGSSLAPEVFQAVFGNAAGYPRLVVGDSTHPAAVSAQLADGDLAKTLVVVASKSGSTLETDCLRRLLWQRLAAVVDQPGRHFVAITDPGSGLAARAREDGYRRIFEAPPDVGGRYSALSPFGLLPAALIGVDLERFLHRAVAMAEACSSRRSELVNPALELAAVLAEEGAAGRDKITFMTSPRLSSFPDWLEQLIAESLGKDGRGLLPVVGEGATAPGDDRLFVIFELAGDEAVALPEAGRAVVRLRLADPHDLAGEIFRWEMATAAAGVALGVQPFDQPDVQLAKELTQRAMAPAADAAAAAPEAQPVVAGGGALQGWLAGADYVAVMAYLPPTGEIVALLDDLRRALSRHAGCAVTVGFGPRFLHSTGQLHKGGPAGGRFVQLIDQPPADLEVPGKDFGFAALVRGQADGDAAALVARQRELRRFDLGSDGAAGLRALVDQLAAVAV
ncbi:MAG: bifunctional transaldolase/phosoglucose isomerase [Acidobacteriota bacterium]